MSNQPAATMTPTQMSELHIKWPDNFDGSTSKANAWMDSVMLYLMINDTLYDRDQK